MYQNLLVIPDKQGSRSRRADNVGSDSRPTAASRRDAMIVAHHTTSEYIH